MGEISLFDNDASVPAHIRAKFAVVNNSDLAAGVSTGFPILSYKGKSWHVAQGDVRTLIKGEDGEPRSSIEVVILKSNPHVSKIFYADGYVEGSSERPTCYSHDGVIPEQDSLELQSPKCAICPRNQWGSRITEAGAKGKECSDSRRMAVAPSGDLENPMLLRVPAATLKDLSVYADMLHRRNTPYQAVVTKIGFDHDVAYPKLTFKALRWLDAGEVDTVAQVIEGATVASIIGDRETAQTAAAGVDQIEGERPANAPVAEKAVTKPGKAIVSEAEIDAVLAPVTPKAEPAPKAAAKAKAAAAPKTTGFGAGEAKAALDAMIVETIAQAVPEETPAQKKLRAAKAAMALLEAEAEAEAETAASSAAPQPEPAAAKPGKHDAILAEAGASLDEVLGILDD